MKNGNTRHKPTRPLKVSVAFCGLRFSIIRSSDQRSLILLCNEIKRIALKGDKVFGKGVWVQLAHSVDKLHWSSYFYSFNKCFFTAQWNTLCRLSFSELLRTNFLFNCLALTSTAPCQPSGLLQSAHLIARSTATHFKRPWNAGTTVRLLLIMINRWNGSRWGA